MEETNIQTNETEVTEDVTVTEEVEVDITEEVKQPETLKKADLLRELSKEHGINLYDAEGLKAFKEYQEAQKTETEKQQELIASYKSQIDDFNKTSEDKDFAIAALELGIPKDQIQAAKALSKLDNIIGETVNERLVNVIEQYKAMFGASTDEKAPVIAVGTQMSNKETETDIVVDEASARRKARKEKKGTFSSSFAGTRQ